MNGRASDKTLSVNMGLGPDVAVRRQPLTPAADAENTTCACIVYSVDRAEQRLLFFGRERAKQPEVLGGGQACTVASPYPWRSPMRRCRNAQSPAPGLLLSTALLFPRLPVKAIPPPEPSLHPQETPRLSVDTYCPPSCLEGH